MAGMGVSELGIAGVLIVVVLDRVVAMLRYAHSRRNGNTISTVDVKTVLLVEQLHGIQLETLKELRALVDQLRNRPCIARDHITPLPTTVLEEPH